MAEFATVGLIVHQSSQRAVHSLVRLIHFLKTQDRAFVLEQGTSASLDDEALARSAKDTVPLNRLGEVSDLVIVVGGDGSMLSAARGLVQSGVPMLGVNRGRLGFLTDITPEDIEEKVGEVLAGQYVAEDRFLLEMKVVHRGQLVSAGNALNDVVLHPGEFIRMLEFELYIDDHFVTSQRSDGMIVSTPTGSTAYALSGGGPILHPRLDAIDLVPMNPHTLSSRPMVVPGDSQIKILLGDRNTTNPQITCDGQVHFQTHPGDEVHITKMAQQLRLVHPRNHNFYERCRSKLGWGGHLLE